MPVGNFEEDELLVCHPDRGLCHVNLEHSLDKRLEEASLRAHAHELVEAAKINKFNKLKKTNIRIH